MDYEEKDASFLKAGPGPPPPSPMSFSPRIGRKLLLGVRSSLGSTFQGKQEQARGEIEAHNGNSVSAGQMRESDAGIRRLNQAKMAVIKRKQREEQVEFLNLSKPHVRMPCPILIIFTLHQSTRNCWSDQ
jgi:hypothetical protein